MHFLCGDELEVDGDEVRFKVGFEAGPGSEIGRKKAQGIFLFVFCPFTRGGADFKVGEGCCDLFTFGGKKVVVEVVIVVQGCPECFCLCGGSIEGFWGCS